MSKQTDLITLTDGVATDSNGNVGIGTDAPYSKLHVVGLAQTNGTVSLTPDAAKGSFESYVHYGAYGDWYIRSASDSGNVILQDTGGNVGIGTDAPVSAIHASGLPTDGILGTFAATAGTYGSKLAINQDGVANWRIGQPAGVDALAFYGFGAGSYPERMRIDGSGNVLIHRLTPDTSAKGVSFTADANGTVLDLGTTYSGFDQMRFRHNGSLVGTVNVTASATSYNTSSDYRLKTDVQPMTGASDRVQALQPVNFEWITAGTRTDGFLAHELQAVVPEAATGTKDAVDEDGNPEYQGIDQSKLVPLLTAALQEALTKIDSLEARLDLIEGGPS